MLLSRMLFSDSAHSREPVLASGTLIAPPRPLPRVGFTDHEGQPFGGDRLRGRWSLLFFGFTSCPDVCPMTLGILAQVEKQLIDLPAQQHPQIVLISVDPKRDTPEQLSKYLGFFSPKFVGVTGAQETVDEFARQMYVPVAITPLAEGGYTVDHSASIFVVGPDGALRALFSPPHSPDVLAADFRRLTRTQNND